MRSRKFGNRGYDVTRCSYGVEDATARRVADAGMTQAPGVAFSARYGPG
jgi:hypothetical protein